VTKSNDKDPWLGGEVEKKPKVLKNLKGSKKPQAESMPEDGDVLNVNDKLEIDTGSVEAAEASVSSEEATADIESDSPVGEQESTGDTRYEFTPSDVPDRDRLLGDEPYYGGRGGTAFGFVRQSEANFVPTEPKLYIAPGTEDNDGEEQFGFPDVPANTQRLFIAIEIPRAVKRELSELPGSFIPREYERVRWIGQDAMHLTLKFLGDIPISKIPEIKDSLQQAAESTGQFTMKIGRTGCFPSFKDPRICWIGFSGELRRLEQLQGRVEGRMVTLGLEPDDRNFAAHVTIGRTRPGIRGRFAEDIGVSWRHAPLKSTGKIVSVTSIALYRSYLDEKEDTQYEQLANFELV